MKDVDEKKIRAELENIFVKIDRIVKRIDTEDPIKPQPEGEQTHPDTDTPPSPDSPNRHEPPQG